MRTPSLLICVFATLAHTMSAQLADPLGAYHAGYTEPTSISKGISDLFDEVSEKHRSVLMALSEAQILLGLAQLSVKKNQTEIYPEITNILSSGKLPKGSKLGIEAGDITFASESKTWHFDALKVYIYIRLDRDLSPFEKGGKWRRIQVLAIPTSMHH
jgi:hypothetical protein